MIRIFMIVLLCAGGLLLAANYTVLQCGCKVMIPDVNKDGHTVIGEDGHPVLIPNPNYVLHQHEQNTRTFVALGLIAAGLILPWAARAFSGRRDRGGTTGASRDTGNAPHGG
jgi:hypothetical protein